ncbi:MAG: aspartate aminotransferase family protein [Pseudomonadota bacterium]
MEIPKKGLTRDEVFKKLEEFHAADLDWRSGRVFGYIYDPGREAQEVSKQAYTMFLTENGLDFTVFPSLFRFETDLAAMAARHLNGGPDVVGNFTSGGTESIILAVKTARDHWRKIRPEIKTPEMVLPVTAHAAFHKAAHYLDVKAVAAEVDPRTFRADPEAVRRAITSNTILLVGSAPSYAHGVVDPIPELGKIALENGLLFHVDACVGGFMLPYFRRLGVEFPDFDFSVPGVTSMSLDLHKYAYAAKGASLVLHKDKELRKNQIFACSKWTGYTIINNAVQSSRSGGPMAAAWSVINFIGDEGYLEIARRKLEATRKITAGIEQIPGLRLMTQPDMCMFSFTSDEINVFHVVDEMNSRGWYIQPQLAYAGSKENIHLSIGVSNVEWADKFLADLAECTEKARAMPAGQLVALVREGLAGVDPSTLSDQDLSGMLGAVGIGGGKLPERMAEINEILNELPPELRERLLVEFINNLFVQAAE